MMDSVRKGHTVNRNIMQLSLVKGTDMEHTCLTYAMTYYDLLLILA